MNFRLLSVISSVTSSVSCSISSVVAVGVGRHERMEVRRGEEGVERAPTRASKPRRPSRPRKAWRKSTDGMVDALTLEPFGATEVPLRCPRCESAYAAASVEALLHRNEGRCLVCGSKRLTTARRHPRPRD